MLMKKNNKGNMAVVNNMLFAHLQNIYARPTNLVKMPLIIASLFFKKLCFVSFFTTL